MTASRAHPHLASLGIPLLLAACGQAPTAPASGPVSLSIHAPIPTVLAQAVKPQGLPSGALPTLHFNVTVRDANGTALTFNDGVYDPNGQGVQHSLLLNSADQYAATLLLPAGPYTFETAAKDGTTDAASTNVLLAYGPAAENALTLSSASHTVNLKFHTVVDPAGSRLDLKDSAADPSANTPLDLSLRPVTALVNGTAYAAPTSDYTPPTYTLAAGSQSTLNGSGSALGVNVTPNDETLNLSANFQAWLRQGSTDTAALSPVTLNFQHAVSGVSTCGTRVTLNVGQVASFTGAAAAKLCLPGGSANAQEYAVIPFNRAATVSYSATTPLTLTGTNITASTFTAQSLPQGQPSALNLPAVSDATPPSEDLSALLRRPHSRIQATGVRAQAIPQGVVPAVDTRFDLNVSSSCSGSADIRTARVESVSQHAIVVQEVVEDPLNPGTYSPDVVGGYARSDYDGIGKNFDVIYDEVTKNFGDATDEDGNGHVVLFFTRKMNELSPPASSAITNGQFLTKDVFSSDPVNGCENSNAGELLYLMVPDPTGAVNSNVRTFSYVTGSLNQTLTKEFTRLNNGFRRAYVTGASFFEQGWLDQGLAQEALELMFYRSLDPNTTMYGSASGATGPGSTWTASTPPAACALLPGQNLVVSNINTGSCASRRVAAFNTYENLIYTSYRSFLQSPSANSIYLKNTPSSTATTNTGNGTMYTATAPFLRYLADRAGGNQTLFWQRLVNSNLEGVANIQNALGGADPQDWLRDWSVATFTDDKAGLTGVDAKFTQPSWNYRSLFNALGGWPLQLRSLSDGAPVTLPYYSGATSYFALGVAAGQNATLAVTSGGQNPPANMSVSVVRVK